MDIAKELCDFVVDTSYDEIPNEALKMAKLSIIDLIGVMVAGLLRPESKKVLEQVMDWGGKSESTAFGFSKKVPCHNAALANSTMARAYDFNDVHDKAFLHPSPSTVPVALAVGEKKGKLNGKDFLTAVILGIDIACKLSMTNKLIPFVTGHEATYHCGLFGATITAGKILDLDKEKMLNALGIAYSQVSGSFQRYLDKAMTIAVQQGMTSSAGIVSALLAQRGITGAQEIFEGKFGYYNIYQQGKYDRNSIKNNLGKIYENINTSIKPYPCCRRTHGVIDATKAIINKYKFEVDDIVEIIVRVNRVSYEVSCQPLEEKRKPKSVVDALWSIPYLVATVIQKGNIDLDDMTEEAINNKKTLRIAQKVIPILDPEIEERMSKEVSPAQVEIKTKGNKLYSYKIEIAKGDPRNQLTEDEVIEKFQKCIFFASKRITTISNLPKKANKIVNLIKNLEKLEDINCIMNILSK